VIQPHEPIGISPLVFESIGPSLQESLFGLEWLLLVDLLMALAAESDQVVWMVRTSVCLRDDMVNFQLMISPADPAFIPVSVLDCLPKFITKNHSPAPLVSFFSDTPSSAAAF